ncbi:MAG TPA: YdcH family protein [Polyangiaceae bacterium]|jgi:uncharacterized protein YdcH (DUF465 family)|nr:YdcH family protein [Polyangiaceae bacterium]
MKRTLSAELSPEARIRTVEHTHRQLDSRLKELGKRVWLTPSEQREVADLKKLKLAAKDELTRLKPFASNHTG